MGNGYNHHARHHQKPNHKTSFLPMLCSMTWMKDDVHLPESHNHRSSSPTVGCIPHLKRSNRVTAYATPRHKPTTFNNHPIAKYSKPKKPLAAMDGSTVRSLNFINHRNNKPTTCLPIDIVNMDPPLPVIKRSLQQQPHQDQVNLWKRRRGGSALKTLQIQQQQVHAHRSMVTSQIM